MTARELHDKLEGERERAVAIIGLAYTASGEGPLRDEGAPLLLDLLDTAREAIAALEGCERACADRGEALERAGLL